MSDSPLYRLSAKRRFGNSFALTINALEIPAGCTCCIVGPVGAGKSTLLRLLSGLEAPDEGEVVFDGHRWNRSSVAALEVLRRIAMVYQRPLLLSGTVRYNVEYGPRVRRTLNPKVIEQTIDRLCLREIVNRPGNVLSGGQSQLVALARAMVIEPQVLLLDEPTSHLDPAHVALVERVLAEIQASHGTTIIWTTHNLLQARRVAQRVGLLLAGELVETGATEEFFDAPSDPRARAFVQGQMIY